MEMPSRYQTSETPLLTVQYMADELKWSRTYVYNFIKDGLLVPQRVTWDERFLFEPEYWEWAKVNVPIVAKRMSDLRVE